MKAEETNVNHYISEACEQLDRYVSENRLYESSLLNGTSLTLLYVVFQGQSLLTCGVYDKGLK